MPNRQRHRGAHPDDLRLFDRTQLKRLRAPAEEVVWLLARGYPLAAAIEFAGNHHQLEARQRLALGRALCSPEQRKKRAARAIERSAAEEPLRERLRQCAVRRVGGEVAEREPPDRDQDWSRGAG